MTVIWGLCPITLTTRDATEWVLGLVRGWTPWVSLLDVLSKSKAFGPKLGGQSTVPEPRHVMFEFTSDNATKLCLGCQCDGPNVTPGAMEASLRSSN